MEAEAVRVDVGGVVESILRQTAEIEMVLVGMAALRGGAPPSPVECHLAVKAYSNLEGLVERVAPSDLVSQKLLQSLIHQFTISQRPPSTPSPAQDARPSSMGASATPASASAPGKSSRGGGKRGRPKASVSKASSTRLKYTISGTRGRHGKGPRSLLRGRGAKVAAALTHQRQTHHQMALEIYLSTPEVVMAALPQTAGAYIDTPIRCEGCKAMINDTTSVLICDGCETGFHLRCLQMPKRSVVPERDWHCLKCESGSRGQAVYGPLRRGRGRRGSRTTWILQTASEQSATRASEYKLKLRNASAAQADAAKASSASHAAVKT